MIYTLNAICSDYILANIITIIKTLINIIRMAVPIFLIVSLTLTFTKGVMDPEDKAFKKKIASAVGSTLIVLFLPFIINVSMALINTYGGVGIRDNGSNIALDVATCWTDADATQDIMDSAAVTNQSIKEEETITYVRPPKTPKVNKRKSTPRQTSSSSTNTSSTNSNQTYNNVVLIGDSRFYGQSNYKFENSKTSYLAKSGEGLNYLKSVENQMKQSDSENSAYVINMGVNDLYNVDNYISYINSLATKYKGDIYYLSVNPVDEAMEKQYGYQVKNSDINKFNDKMRSGLKNVTYLDSNAYLKSNGFATTDGVHYTKDTYNKIYNYISSNVKS